MIVLISQKVLFIYTCTNNHPLTALTISEALLLSMIALTTSIYVSFRRSSTGSSIFRLQPVLSSVRLLLVHRLISARGIKRCLETFVLAMREGSGNKAFFLPCCKVSSSPPAPPPPIDPRPPLALSSSSFVRPFLPPAETRKNKNNICVKNVR